MEANALMRGAGLAVPVILGYLPVSFAYGILAVKAGLAPVAIFAMSLIVYAGSSQFIAVSLFVAGASPASLILTTFIVNLRHMLMSASLIPYLRALPKPLQVLFGLELTDETYAVNINNFMAHGADMPSAFAINSLSHASWMVGTILGIFCSDLLGDVKVFGMDYALPALFIALITPHLKNLRRFVAVGVSMLLTVLLALNGAGSWAIIGATIIAATLAAALPTANISGNNASQG